MIIVKGPPITIPKVPAKNIIKALGPNATTPFISILKVKSTKEAGSKYREAIKYKPDSSPEIIPIEFKIEGKK